MKPEACLGRDEKEVQTGLQAAREHGVSEEFLKATEGYTGCVGVLDTGRPGPTMAMRFDIDCIPVQETDDPNHIPNKDGFRSKHNGFMHACGHDCHMSIGLTTAKWIVDNKDSLTGRIKIVFQPAEEGVRGANAVAAACAATMQLLGIPRHGSGMTRVNVGILQAGTGRNVIPAHAKLVMEVRGETAAINDYMSEQAMNIIKGCAISYGVKYDVRTMGAACDMKNDPEMVKMLREVAGTIPEVKQITGEANFGGSEDASLLAKRVTEHGGKAAFFVTGADRKAGHHQFNFDVNEPALDVGFRMFTGMVKKICGRK